MDEPSKKAQPTPVLGAALISGLFGCGLLATGVASVLHLIRGGVPMGALCIVVSVGVFGLAGYFVWAYVYLRRRPEKLPTEEAASWQKHRLRAGRGSVWWPVGGVALVLAAMWSFGGAAFAGHTVLGCALLAVALGFMVQAYRRRT